MTYIPKSINRGVPSNPTGTTSATPLMAGAGVYLTPNATGNVVVIFNANLSNSTNGDTVIVGGYYGTGTKPTNLAPQTGTKITTQFQLTKVQAAGANYSWSGNGTIAGLTIGIQYWFDFVTKSAGGTVSLNNTMIIPFEI